MIMNTTVPHGEQESPTSIRAKHGLTGISCNFNANSGVKLKSESMKNN
jgi:hypothetical protein